MRTSMLVLRLTLMAVLALLTGGVVVPGGAEAAVPSKVRYTVTVTYHGTYGHHWTRWYPSGAVEWDDWFESSSYAARSTRPFTITRDGRSFAFAAPLTGTIGAVGSGPHGFFGDLSGDDTSDVVDCRTTRGMWTDAGAPLGAGIRLSYGHTEMLVGASPAAHSVNYAYDMRCTPTGYRHAFSSDDWSIRSWLGWYVNATQVRQHYGKAFTITSEANAPVTDEGGPTANRLVLRFTPVGKEQEEAERELWQVEVTGRDTWSWGMYTTLGAGIHVKWAHRTTLEIEDGKIVSATGKVRVVDVTPFSDVDGALTVTQKKTSTPPAYKITKKALTRTAGGDRVTLGLLKPGSSEYRADFTVAAGPQLLQTLRAMNVPDPEARYQGMVARGPVPNRIDSLVPADPRIVVPLQSGRSYPRETDSFTQQLPCTAFGGNESECFLTRGGEIITVTRLR